jgi:hypothetical protein
MKYFSLPNSRPVTTEADTQSGIRSKGPAGRQRNLFFPEQPVHRQPARGLFLNTRRRHQVKNQNSMTDQKGSVLLITMILTLGLAIFLSSFLKLSMGAYRLSDRSFYSNSVLNLSEAGLEEALYALNSADWSGWTASGGHMSRTITGLGLGQGSSGSIRIRVYDYATDLSPRIVAEGQATLKSGKEITRQIEIEASKKSFWANGIVARDTIEFKGGNAYVDSFDSADPAHSTGGLYDFSKRKDNGSVGSLSVNADALSVSNVDIWGYAATGGVLPTVGPGGKIHGVDTPAGVDVDADRIRTDFTANFASITAPTSFDQIYTNIDGTVDLGTSGSTTVIKASSIGNSNGEVTQILGDVTLVVSGDIKIGGDFVIDANSSLTVYVEGDVTVGGNGVMNITGLSKNLVLYGTASSQTIKLHGNGAIQAAIFAPNADLELKGGGAVGVFSGAVLAKTVFFNGDYEFHYDEDLEKVGLSSVYTVDTWRELYGQGQWVSL